MPVSVRVGRTESTSTAVLVLNKIFSLHALGVVQHDGQHERNHEHYDRDAEICQRKNHRNCNYFTRYRCKKRHEYLLGFQNVSILSEITSPL